MLKQLQLISGVINTNTVLPILEDFLFDVENNTMTIVATDLETVMKVRLDVGSMDVGKVCIPAKILLDCLKSIPDQPLTFNIGKNFDVEIVSINGKYKLPGEDPDNFPKDPSPDEANGFVIKGKSLVTAISKTLFAVSTDDLRPAMTGVFFELSPEGVQFVSTDAHRLVRYKRTDAFSENSSSFIVPKKPLNILKSSIPDTDEEIEVRYNTNHLFVKSNNIEMACRLIEGRFPDYKVVIPFDNPYKLIVNRTELQGALRRVSIFSNKSTNQVAFHIKASEVQLLSQDVDFNHEGNERLSCQFDGEDMSIAFNAKFLIEMLGATNTSEIRLELSTPARAGIIKPTEDAEGEELLMLVMPLMLNN